jgi:hypothetical protein
LNFPHPFFFFSLFENKLFCFLIVCFVFRISPPSKF